MNLQPTLSNEYAQLVPLSPGDFESLYAVAADPLIWAQHPNPDRWRREVFSNFFDGAIQSGGAFKIVHLPSGELAGSTRMYDYDAAANRLLIGYTFYARKFWGTGINRAVKKLMLDYAFGHVAEVDFHIGAVNRRSQIAIERLGALKVDEQEVAYFGETPKLNYVYRIRRDDWLTS